jgi:hypothetical protein
MRAVLRTLRRTAMRIHVQWADISSGKSSSTTECMVALALKKELGVSYASVGHRDATILLNGEYVKIYLPRNVGDKIRFWDRFHVVLPFSFELTCSGFLTGQSIERLSCATTPTVRVARGELLETYA